jgi:hypothetical protein
VIAIGQPEGHALLAAYDARLPQPLRRVNGRIQPVSGRELLAEETSGQAGYVELLPAPWAQAAWTVDAWTWGLDGHGALAVLSGPDDEALARASAAFPAMGTRMKVQGNVAVAAPGGVTGLELGSLAGAPLSGTARGALATILIGVAGTIGGVALVTVTFRRRQTRGRHKARDGRDGDGDVDGHGPEDRDGVEDDYGDLE